MTYQRVTEHENGSTVIDTVVFLRKGKFFIKTIDNKIVTAKPVLSTFETESAQAFLTQNNFKLKI